MLITEQPLRKCRETVAAARKAPLGIRGGPEADIEAKVWSDYQDTSAYWTDRKQTPWRDNDYGHSDTQSYCLCDRYKEAFYAYAGIQEPLETLTNEKIRTEYKEQSGLFREELDAEINRMVCEASKDLGLDYMVYDDKNHHDNRYWY